MPRFSYVHKGGTKIISCGKCNLYLTNKSELISNKFQGATGRAYLYNRVWNVCCSEKQHRDMMTGKHIVRDVMCLRCNEKLGWMYEFAMEEQQRYKEMRVILEKALIDESEGFPDPELGYADTCLPRSINDPPDAPPTQRVMKDPVETLARVDLGRKKRTT